MPGATRVHRRVPRQQTLIYSSIGLGGFFRRSTLRAQPFPRVLRFDANVEPNRLIVTVPRAVTPRRISTMTRVDDDPAYRHFPRWPRAEGGRAKISSSMPFTERISSSSPLSSTKSSCGVTAQAVTPFLLLVARGLRPVS